MTVCSRPNYNLYSSAFCWIFSLVSAYFAQGMRSAAKPPLSTSPHPSIHPALLGLTGSFRERFGPAYLLPASIIVWTVFYVILCRSMWRCFGKHHSDRLYEGFPGWSYMVGCYHGAVILPLLLFLAVLVHCVESGDALHDYTQWFGNFFMNGTWGTAEATSRLILEQLNCAVIGYLLKDFSGLYAQGLDVGFLLHHIGSIVGCSLCLHFPSLIGLIAFNTVQCEFASSMYNFKTLFHDSYGAQLLFFGCMGVSNIITIPIGVVVWHASIATEYRYTYGVLTALIVFLRCGGWAVNVQAYCSTPRGSGSGSSSTKEVETSKKETKKDQ